MPSALENMPENNRSKARGCPVQFQSWT